MKSHIYIFLLIAVTSLSINAQNSSPQERLIGTWTLDYQSSFSNMKSDLQERFGTLSETDKNRIISIYQGRKLIFTQEGTFTQTLSDGRNIHGDWTLSDNGTVLSITSPGGHKLKQKIISLTASILVLKLDTPNADRAYFSTMHFKRD